MVDDGRLLEAWQGGDESAGNTLVRRHFTSVYRFFHNKVQGELEDLVQLVFMKCAQSRSKIGQSPNFRAYLFGIALTVVLIAVIVPIVVLFR